LERLSAPAPLVWRLATVQDVVAETTSARSLTLEVPEWRGHRPGQYLDVRLTADDGYQAQRSFSIASPPEADGLTLTIERIDDGEVSPYLADEVRVGDQIEVRGPIGRPFTWVVQDGGPLLLVAGGSGLVPLMAMLRHRAAQRSLVLTGALISVRTLADALYREELERLRMGEMLDVRWTSTRGEALSPRDFTGRVDEAMLTELELPAALAPRVFVCGPTGFVEHAANLLVDQGHDARRIQTERFGPS
jgi:ferredoxin-NADP reductase